MNGPFSNDYRSNTLGFCIAGQGNIMTDYGAAFLCEYKSGLEINRCLGVFMQYTSGSCEHLLLWHYSIIIYLNWTPRFVK